MGNAHSTPEQIIVNDLIEYLEKDDLDCYYSSLNNILSEYKTLNDFEKEYNDNIKRKNPFRIVDIIVESHLNDYYKRKLIIELNEKYGYQFSLFDKYNNGIYYNLLIQLCDGGCYDIELYNFLIDKGLNPNFIDRDRKVTLIDLLEWHNIQYKSTIAIRLKEHLQKKYGVLTFDDMIDEINITNLL